MSEWQPIETAPKDGEFVLLWSNYMDRAVTGLWRDAELLPESCRVMWPDMPGIWCEDIYISYDPERKPYRPIHEVTHWMPLPSPPK